MGVVAWHRTHAPVWWLCGGEEAHGRGGFVPVPTLEHVEGDDAIPSGEHAEAYGTIGLEHALVLQLPAAGEHGASAQERDDIMRGEHSAAFFAARSFGEPAFPARRRSNPAGVSNKRCKVAQAESNGVCRHEVQGRPGRPYAEHAEFAKLSAAVPESMMHTFAGPHRRKRPEARQPRCGTVRTRRVCHRRTCGGRHRACAPARRASTRPRDISAS